MWLINFILSVMVFWYDCFLLVINKVISYFFIFFFIYLSYVISNSMLLMYLCGCMFTELTSCDYKLVNCQRMSSFWRLNQLLSLWSITNPGWTQSIYLNVSFPRLLALIDSTLTFIHLTDICPFLNPSMTPTLPLFFLLKENSDWEKGKGQNHFPPPSIPPRHQHLDDTVVWNQFHFWFFTCWIIFLTFQRCDWSKPFWCRRR